MRMLGGYVKPNCCCDGYHGRDGDQFGRGDGHWGCPSDTAGGKPLGNIAAVTGGVLMSASGDVTATSSTSTAKGINVIAAVTAVNGTVKISQDGAVSGGVLASGITLVGVTSIGAIQISSGPANALTKTTRLRVVLKFAKMALSRAITAMRMGLYHMAELLGLNGTVTVKTGVDTIGAITASATAKTIKAKTGQSLWDESFGCGHDGGPCRQC